MPPSTIRTLRPERRAVLSLAGQVAPNGVYVEIGTHNGDFAVDILDNCAVAKLYCVDPYKSYAGFDDAINNEPLDEVYAVTASRLAPYGDKVEILRMTSVEAAQQFANDSVDFVYIDGNHAYAYALQDFEAWFPKLRNGGLMCGDDAVDVEDDSARNAAGDVVRVWATNDKGEPTSWGHYGVMKAAKEFCLKYQLQLLQTGVQILIFKGAVVKDA
jgi:predicted O-methyltransferase YrrM